MMSKKNSNLNPDTETKVVWTHLKIFLLTVFLRLYDGVFFFQNNSKDVDPYYKTDPDLWDCLGMVKLVL